jgi:hypothetical protein
MICKKVGARIAIIMPRTIISGYRYDYLTQQSWVINEIIFRGENFE